MNKKDYIKLAQAIKENTTPLIPQDKIFKTTFINALCDILSADNPNFDKVKFMEACK